MWCGAESWFRRHAAGPGTADELPVGTGPAGTDMEGKGRWSPGAEPGTQVALGNRGARSRGHRRAPRPRARRPRGRRPCTPRGRGGRSTPVARSTRHGAGWAVHGTTAASREQWSATRNPAAQGGLTAPALPRGQAPTPHPEPRGGALRPPVPASRSRSRVRSRRRSGRGQSAGKARYPGLPAFRQRKHTTSLDPGSGTRKAELRTHRCPHPNLASHPRSKVVNPSTIERQGRHANRTGLRLKGVDRVITPAYARARPEGFPPEACSPRSQLAPTEKRTNGQIDCTYNRSRRDCRRNARPHRFACPG